MSIGLSTNERVEVIQDFLSLELGNTDLILGVQ